MISRQEWRWSVLAAMASYLDAGSELFRGHNLRALVWTGDDAVDRKDAAHPFTAPSVQPNSVYGTKAGSSMT
jgi:hypothetical protein